MDTDPLQFIIPHGGETLPDKEASEKEAAEVFEALVDDIILAHLAYSNTTEFTTIPNRTSVGLFINNPDGSYLTFEVKTRAVDVTSDKSRKSVNISEHDTDHATLNTYSYVLEPDSQKVVRSDQLAIKQRLEDESAAKDENYEDRRRDLTQSLTINEMAKAALEALSDSRANHKLEAEFGVNHLPVGADEINKLRQLLESAEVDTAWSQNGGMRFFRDNQV